MLLGGPAGLAGDGAASAAPGIVKATTMPPVRVRKSRRASVMRILPRRASSRARRAACDPQRHRLPSSGWWICASVGARCCSSSAAAAAITMPEVQ